MAKASFTLGAVTLSYTVGAQAAADIASFAQSAYPAADAASSVKLMLRGTMQGIADNVRRWKEEQARAAVTAVSALDITEDT